MKYCPNCGAEVKENSKFCSKCGSSITNVVNEVNRNAMNSQNSKESSNNVIIIAVAAVIIVAIIAGTFVFLSGNDSGSDVIVVNNSDSDDAVEESSDSGSSSSSNSGSSSSSSDAVTYSQAQSMYPNTASNVISNAFDEADANKDGLLTGSEINEFKRLAKLAINTASESDSTTYNEHGSITRYCTTHGRVTTGEDLQCPYCKAEGLDSRTVKGSTEYN